MVRGYQHAIAPVDTFKVPQPPPLQSRVDADGIVRLAWQRSAATIGLSAHLSPDELRSTLEEALRVSAGESIRISVDEIEHLRPARPQPTHRFDSVVWIDGT